ncbi:MAG: hypothetical protein J6J35_00760 [Alphaproteobacteria bacterium]|nr:hypothetical protein [Alphaproteobacteria bacterium]
MIDTILEFIKQVGEKQLRLRCEKGLDIGYKGAQPVTMVTKTDLEISRLFEAYAAEHFSDLDYLILDEESFGKYGSDVKTKMNNCEYLFVLDPLDGTVHYSQNIPLFGVSLGVFKKGKPYLGALYLPALGELVFVNDKNEAYWVKNAFNEQEHFIRLHEDFVSNSPLIVDLQRHFELDNSKNVKNYLFVDYFCSVFCYVLLATGRARCGMFKDWLWDMAGGWCIFRALGYRLYDVKAGKYLEKLDTDDLTDDLKFKNAHIIGKEEDIAYLKNVIVKDKGL